MEQAQENTQSPAESEAEEQEERVKITGPQLFDDAKTTELHEGSLAVIAEQAMRLKQTQRNSYLADQVIGSLRKELKIAKAERDDAKKRLAETMNELLQADKTIADLRLELEQARAGLHPVL
jgi:multidrug resistance efflux pump